MARLSYPSLLVKPHSPRVTINSASPFAEGLVSYWGFSEGVGRRFVDAVRGIQMTFSGSYPGRWGQSFMGPYAEVLASDATGQTATYPSPLAGISTRATMGGLFWVQNLDGTGPTNGVIVDGGPAWYISANGTINQAAWVKWNTSPTNYIRPNTGQLTANTWYTLFATFVSGGNGQEFYAPWPNGVLKEFTYNDRGTAAITLGSVNLQFVLTGNFTGTSRFGWLGFWNRNLRLDEMWALHRDPWQLWYRRRASYDFAAGLAGGWASRIYHDRAPSARIVS